MPLRFFSSPSHFYTIFTGRVWTVESNCKILAGSRELLQKNLEKLADQAIDQTLQAPEGWSPLPFETSIAKPFSVTGPGTYSKGVPRTLHFAPSQEGWSFNRCDIPEQFPIRVAPENVWTAQRSIVLRCGNEHNYVRMVEHIIAQRLGLGIDNMMISVESGDPPLFDVGSMPIVDGIQDAGIQQDISRRARYFTVKESSCIVADNGSFLVFEPSDDHRMHLDVAIDFPNAIGKQRIQFELCPETFKYGAHARTNCPRHEMIYAMTIGKLFADIRNLGYTKDNILVAGKREYVNQPAMMHNGKSLEAVWHRACLDLVAALSLFPMGRLCGKVTSYKAGHCLDCRMMSLLSLNDCWIEVK